MVFVKKSLKGCFEDIRATSVGAGILGVMVRDQSDRGYGEGG